MPVRESIAEPLDPRAAQRFPKLHLGLAYIKWFGSLIHAIQQAPEVIGSTALSAQAASIGSTSIATGDISAGLYRVSYTFRVTTPASVSSSLTFNLSWTDGGIAQSVSGAAATGNTTTTVQSGVVIVRCDSSSVVAYSTTYASTGGTAMEYQLDVSVERLVVD